MSELAPVMARAFLRWQHGAGPYWAYVCAAPFLGQPALPFPRRLRNPPPSSILQILSEVQVSENAAVFADLPVAEALPAAPELRRSGFAVVPVIQRWAVTNALLPCRRLLEDLAVYAPRRRHHGEGRGVVFLLDGDRGGMGDTIGRVSPARFDNRYDYPICRFPPPTLLQREGVTAVYWLSCEGIAEDLLPYAEVLGAAGLAPRPLPAARVPAG